MPKLRKIEVEARATGKGGFPHFMLKEIHEQPHALREGMKGRIILEEATARFTGLHRTNEQLRDLKRIILTGCGTTFHAALAGEYMIESLARTPVECDYASEFRYRNAPLDSETAVFVMSQSGETADTLAALRESKRKGALTSVSAIMSLALLVARVMVASVYGQVLKSVWRRQRHSPPSS